MKIFIIYNYTVQQILERLDIALAITYLEK